MQKHSTPKVHLLNLKSRQNMKLIKKEMQEPEKNSTSAKSSIVSKVERKVQPFPHHLLSDFQCFVAHECFGYYMFLCFTLKAIRICLATGTKPNESEMLNMLTTKQGEDDLSKFVIHLQTSLIKIPNKEFNPRVHRLYKGKNKLIDGLMLQAIGVLRGELSKCFDLYQKGSGNKDSLTSPPKIKRTRNAGKGGGKKKSDAIAVKYSKAQTDILNAWMIENKVCRFWKKTCIHLDLLDDSLFFLPLFLEQSHPFPTKTEINALCEQTDLSYSQVVNWTTNVRKRNLKATVEKGKKPHHFLDFLFLADHRDKQHNTDVILSFTKSKSTSKRKKKGKVPQVKNEESPPPRRKNPSRSATKSHYVLPTAKSYDSEHTALTASTVADTDSFSSPERGMKKEEERNESSPTSVALPPLPVPKSRGKTILTSNKMHPNYYEYPYYPGKVLPSMSQSPQFLASMFPVFGYTTADQNLQISMSTEATKESKTSQKSASSMNDENMLTEITKNGLVATPPRRESNDDIAIDANDQILLHKINNVFEEREKEDMEKARLEENKAMADFDESILTKDDNWDADADLDAFITQKTNEEEYFVDLDLFSDEDGLLQQV